MRHSGSEGDGADQNADPQPPVFLAPGGDQFHTRWIHTGEHEAGSESQRQRQVEPGVEHRHRAVQQRTDGGTYGDQISVGDSVRNIKERAE